MTKILFCINFTALLGLFKAMLYICTKVIQKLYKRPGKYTNNLFLLL